MGEVKATITLRNLEDLAACKRGYIPEGDIHTATLEVKADTGAMTELVINEETRERLGLEIVNTKTARGVGNTPVPCGITDVLELTWKNRWISCNAWVVPAQKEPLLGVIAMEKLDVRPNPGTGELEGIHGEEAVGILD